MTPPFPPRGPLGRFPRLAGTMKALRFPTAGLARLRIARRTETAVASASFPSTGTRGRGPGSWSAGSRAGTSAGAVGPPRSLGNPDAPLPWSSTPAGPDSPGRLRRSGAAPPTVNEEGSRELSCERGSIQGFGARCLRFTTPVARSPRKTRFRRLARRCRAGLGTRRVPPQGFGDSHLVLLAQAYPGALTVHESRVTKVQSISGLELTSWMLRGDQTEACWDRSESL